MGRDNRRLDRITAGWGSAIAGESPDGRGNGHGIAEEPPGNRHT